MAAELRLRRVAASFNKKNMYGNTWRLAAIVLAGHHAALRVFSEIHRAAD